MLNETNSRMSRIIRGIFSGKKISLVFVIMLIMLLAMSTSVMAGTYSGGNGNTAGTAYEIDNKANLSELSTTSGDWGAYFKQTSNITLVASDFQNGGIFYNEGAGFSPIGDFVNGAFTGSYDGQGHTISGLYVKRSQNCIGLLGFISGATIENIGVTNVNIKLSAAPNEEMDAGGLVGYIISSTIVNCYSTGSVSGAIQVGGLAGYNDGGSISNSYSTCSVTGTGTTGGLVGGCCGYENPTTVSNCYSAGSVTADENVGGLSGTTSDGVTFSNCFWDTQTSGQATSAGGTGKTTAQMKALATFTDVSTVGLTTAWDFVTNPNDDTGNNDYWDLDYSEVINNGYPYLSWEDGEDVSLPVELSSFTATAGDGKITLNWSTESEIDNLGFHVYRASSEDGEYQRLTAELIQGAGTSTGNLEYRFMDVRLTNGVTVWYQLEDVAFDGARTMHGPISATPHVKTQEIEQRAVPDCYDLAVNFPNPFNPQTTIAYQLPEAASVQLTIYNAAGQVVRTLMDERKEAGFYRALWDGADEAGRQAASGVYFYKLEAGDFMKVRRMVLVR